MSSLWWSRARFFPGHLTKRGGCTSWRDKIVFDATALWPTGCAMREEQTTFVVQRYLDELAGDSPSEPIVRAFLDWAVRRLYLLCATLLHRCHPRLTLPALTSQPYDLLSVVSELLV